MLHISLYIKFCFNFDLQVFKIYTFDVDFSLNVYNICLLIELIIT